jgi:hypothetical protein
MAKKLDFRINDGYQRATKKVAEVVKFNTYLVGCRIDGVKAHFEASGRTPEEARQQVADAYPDAKPILMRVK